MVRYLLNFKAQLASLWGVKQLGVASACPSHILEYGNFTGLKLYYIHIISVDVRLVKNIHGSRCSWSRVFAEIGQMLLQEWMG